MGKTSVTRPVHWCYIQLCEVHNNRSSVFPQKYLQYQVRTHTHPFNGPFSGTIRVSRYQKDKTNLDFTEARDSEWQ